VLFAPPVSDYVRYITQVQQKALKTGAPIPDLVLGSCVFSQETAGGSSAGSTDKVL